MKNFSLENIIAQVNTCYARENFNKAKKILENALELAPDEYWIITNLAIAYYEIGKFKKALEYSEKAFNIAPADPIVSNYHATILRVNDKFKEAIEIWKQILNKSDEELLKSRFGEGKKWAISLKNDIRYNIGNAYSLIDDYKTAISFYQTHLDNRKRGLYSLYSKQEVESEMNEAKWYLEEL